MNKQGILLIISGPSGSGKGTIVERLCEKNNFSLSISATTRKPREYEKDGVHYFFHTREEFEKMRDRKELLEWAEFCGNYYGTPRKYVTEQLMAGKENLPRRRADFHGSAQSGGAGQPPDQTRHRG